MNITITMKLIVALLIAICMTGTYSASAEMIAANGETIERVVAIVDDEIVLLSEFKEALSTSRASGERLSDDEVINQMINRIILLGEAKKFGLHRSGGGHDSVNSIINEFINRRIKAFIHIPYDDIESYYYENENLQKEEFYVVKDEIEQLLVSQELVNRLSEYIKERRQKSYIRVQLIE